MAIIYITYVRASHYEVMSGEHEFYYVIAVTIIILIIIALLVLLLRVGVVRII